jgi:sugar phosphate isomerase/epimerase
MLLGVHSHLFRGSPAVVAETVRSAGLNCVQLTPNFPGMHFADPIDFTAERCRAVAEPFVAAGIRIVALSGYVNLLNPNLDSRHRNIIRLHTLIRCCWDFGTCYLVTESGSLSPGSPLTTYLLNRSQAAWAELRLILAESLRLAEEHSVTLLLKPAPSLVVATVEDALRLREELPHPSLGFVMDPASFLIQSEPDALTSRLEDLVKKLGDCSPIVHAKDLRWDADGAASSPRVGLGVLDYGLLCRLLPDRPIILEHVQPEEVGDARDFLLRNTAIG